MRLDPYGRRFGYGVARLPVRAEPYRVSPSLSLREGAALGASEWRSQGKVAVRTAGFAGTAFLAALLLAGFWIAATDRDPGAVELVAFAEPPPEPVIPPLEELIVPEPIQELAPEPEPEPPPVVEKPKPVPPPVAKPTPPKREPVKREPPKAKPRARPKPVPLIAQAKPPPPAPTPRPKRSRPQPVPAAPRPSVEPLGGPTPEPLRDAARRVARAERLAVPKAARPTVALDAVAQPKAESPREKPRWRSAREAAPTPKLARRPDLAPAAVVPPEPRGPEPSRRVARAPRAQASRNTPRPALSLEAAAPGLPSGVPATAPARSRREAPQVARVSNGLARDLAMPGQPAPTAPAPTPAAPASSDRPTARTRRSNSRRDDRKSLRGVPLGSLAACDSDRREDALKQRLIAAVTTQTDCTSGAGVYRFLETRNLNAFLMTIERSGTRGLADRCAELSHAIECVTGSRKESRRR